MHAFKSARRQTIHLRQFRKQTERLLEMYELNDKEFFLTTIDSKIRELKTDLSAYEELHYHIEATTDFDLVRGLGKTLLNLRIWLGWSQATLGNYSGINVKSIHAYERDEYRKTRLEKIFQIMQALEHGILEKTSADNRYKRSPYQPTLSFESVEDTYKNAHLPYDEDAEFMIVDGQLVEPPHEPDAMDDFSTGL